MHIYHICRPTITESDIQIWIPQFHYFHGSNSSDFIIMWSNILMASPLATTIIKSTNNESIDHKKWN